MSWASVAAARLRGLFEHEQLDGELDEEVRFHLEMQIEDNLRAGMTPGDARRAALRSFGGIEPMKERYREQRAFTWVEATAQDLRYALRTLAKNPAFTSTAVTVLALAIGVNTAMFSVLNAVLFRPLPYKSPERLVMLWSQDPGKNLREGRIAYGNVEQWRSQSRSFEEMAFFDDVSVTLTTADRAEKISVLRTSPDLLPLLGVQPLHGRSFMAEEAEQRQRLALISYPFWQSHFGGSFEAIGASIQLDGVTSRIVGILPADFRFADSDVWEPHTMYPDWKALRQARGTGFWAVVGRLRPNVTLGQAEAELNAIARRLDAEVALPERSGGIRVVPLSHQVVGPRQRLTLWMLAGAVLLVLLIAATNVANLSLARNASREREIAIRVALGASRARIVRQLLAESLTLAMTAGLLGLAVALATLRLAGRKTRQPRPAERGHTRSVRAWRRCRAVPPHRNAGGIRAGPHHDAAKHQAFRPRWGKRNRRRNRHRSDTPRSGRDGICRGDHSAGWRRPVGAQLAVGRKRGSGIQA